MSIRGDLIFEITQKTPETLVKLAVLNAGRCAAEKRSKWWYVAESLGVGSTVATLLCEHFGVAPDELAGGCEVCEEGCE